MITFTHKEHLLLLLLLLLLLFAVFHAANLQTVTALHVCYTVRSSS